MPPDPPSFRALCARKTSLHLLTFSPPAQKHLPTPLLIETVPNIPLALKRSILEDVSRGLLYLHKHTPQIIHRDLTAKNVLLNSYFMAKITDLGNSRIINLQPGQLARTLSRLPGTLVYMPPEALSSSSRYGPSLDIFSFGHLALFTLTQVYGVPSVSKTLTYALFVATSPSDIQMWH